MGYVGPQGRKGVDVAPFRKLFVQIVGYCGTPTAAGRLCGFASTQLAWKVMHEDRIEHTTGKKILATWRRLKAEGALVPQGAKEAA